MRVQLLARTKRVLFVVDSCYHASRLNDLCDDLGVASERVDFVSGGLQAIQKILKTFEGDCNYFYTLVVLEYEMPRISGPDTAPLISGLFATVLPRGRYFVPKPNLVSYTKNNTEETLQEVLQSGMTA